MPLGIQHPKGVETAYRRYLNALTTKSFNRFKNNTQASTADLEAAALAGFAIILTRIERYNIRQIKVTFEDVMDVEVAKARIERASAKSIKPQLDRARRANANLIKDITKKQRARVALEVARESDVALSTRLQDVLGIGKRRASIIARDQTAKINGALSEARHTAAGAKSYKWRTAGDERVRQRHSDIDGVEYRYDEETGAEGGQKPGQPVLCRCYDEPIFED